MSASGEREERNGWAVPATGIKHWWKYECASSNRPQSLTFSLIMTRYFYLSFLQEEIILFVFFCIGVWQHS